MDPANYGGIKGKVASSVHCGEVRNLPRRVVGSFRAHEIFL